MKNSTSTTVPAQIMIAASGALTAFWILNIFKEAYGSVKSFLTLSQGIGPLSGLYILSAGVLLVLYGLFRLLQFQINERVAYIWYVVTSILFFFMVFPPIWEPIVRWLTSN